jgi:hypothetical protein
MWFERRPPPGGEPLGVWHGLRQHELSEQVDDYGAAMERPREVKVEVEVEDHILIIA